MNNERIAKELLKAAELITQPLKMKWIVTRDKIYVASNATTFANYERKEFDDSKLDDVMDKMKKVKTLARKNNVTIRGYTKRAKELKQLNAEYNYGAKSYNKTFDDLYKTWKKIEKQKDLFYPPLAELEGRIPEYDDAVRLGWKLEKMFHGGEVLSKLGSIERSVDDALRTLKYSDEGLTMVGI